MKNVETRIETTHQFIDMLRELISNFNFKRTEQNENYEMCLVTFTDHMCWSSQICAEYFIALDKLVRQAMSNLNVSRDYLNGAANANSMSLITVNPELTQN